ncbi:MAG: MurR/RpiR family transcriptional regulator [Kangiellaceae bacterium]|nr:MurR/RpiR family transcriptional regulator [Kangiellaceae bacterium]
MSVNEKKLADYILSNSALLRDYSSQQLASAVGVSQSSVVKFCQKLGYKGYPDIKLAINEAVARDPNHSGKNTSKRFSDSDLNNVSDRILKNKLDAIAATIELNEESSFKAAIAAIKNAEKIQIFGVGVSRFVAEHLAIRLLNSDKLAFALNDSAYQKQFLSRLEKGDLLILLSAIEELKINPVLINEMRERNVKIIHIGRYSANSPHHLADITLSTISAQESSEKHDFAKRAAQQHIVDILLAMSVNEGLSD